MWVSECAWRPSRLEGKGILPLAFQIGRSHYDAICYSFGMYQVFRPNTELRYERCVKTHKVILVGQPDWGLLEVVFRAASSITW